jgi:uncharacterized membrane protein YczE
MIELLHNVVRWTVKDVLILSFILLIMILLGLVFFLSSGTVVQWFLHFLNQLENHHLYFR